MALNWENGVLKVGSRALGMLYTDQLLTGKH